jgi:flagellar basal-body rod protein FlgF
MSTYGLYTSGLGAIGQSMKIDQIANNIANVNTPGFRRDVMAFGERLVEALEDSPDLAYYNALVHRNGGAPLVESVGFEKTSGGYDVTRRPLDFSIVGEGWFTVQDLETGATAYTRAGNFTMNNSGRLTTSDGRHQVLSADGRGIAFDPTGTGELRVREDGLLFQGDVEIGRLGITGFEDESRLRKQGGNLFRNEGSGTVAPAAGTRVEQGALERSGVNPVLEMVEMIKSFRVLETNQEMVRLQDAVLDRSVNDFGRPQR